MVDKLTQKIGSDAEIVGKAIVDEGLVVKENGNVVIDSDHDIADSGLKAVKIDKPTLVTDTLLVGNLDEDMEHGMQFAVTPEETLVGGDIRQPASDTHPTATFQNTTVASLTVNDLSEGLIVSNSFGELSVDSTVDLTELHALEGISNNVQQQINDEISNRTSADNELQGKLDTEKSERQSADESLSGRIDDEVSTRTSEVASLTEAIQTESDARLEEDNKLNTKINTEISEREEDVSELNNAVAGLTTQLNEETTARTRKDSELQTAIETEVSTRTSEVSGLRTDLTTETTERTQAISGLTNSLNSEIADRQNADGLLQTAIDNEVRDRTNGDSALDSRLDAIEERIVLPWEGQDTLAKTSDLNNAIGQVNIDLAKKVDKITDTHSNTVAYVQSSGGDETYIPISASATPDAIALRNPNGTVEVPDPNMGGEATNKSYVDSEVQQTRDALQEHVDNRDNPHAVTKEQVGLQYVENYPMDTDPMPDSPNYVSSGGVSAVIDSVLGTIHAHTEDLDNPHRVSKEQLDLGNVVNRSMDSQPESGSMNYVESGGVYTAIQNVVGSLNAHENDESNPHNVTKEQVGLGNVDNTSDMNKPISTAQREEFNAIQSDLDEHVADKNNPHEVTKTQVGLQYVENYPMDAIPTSSSSNYVSSGGVYDEIERVVGLIDGHVSDDNNPHNVTKEQVGLDRVDNTADIDKPISTAQQTAINGVQSNLDDHEDDTNNPHNVTKTQVGLGSVVNVPMDTQPTDGSDNYVTSGGVYTAISSEHTDMLSAVSGVQTNLTAHESRTDNPHQVTKAQVGLGNVDNTSDMAKPVSTAQSVAIGNVQSALDTHKQTYATASTYGHVKMDGTIGDGNRTDVTISEAGIKAYVNSSIGTSTADFLGTYNAVADLGFTQTVVDTWTDPPTSAVESTVGNAITSVLNAESITPTSNDYVFVSVNESITTDIDWFWRFKFDGSVWLYEYTLNNSSFTQAQWDAINSGISSTKVSNYDNHVSSRSNPHGVTKAQVGLGNVDNTSDLSKPISTATQTALDNKVGTVNQTGSGYVSAVAIDTNDKTKLNVTRTAIPNVAVTGGTAESGKYVSAIATNGHGITVTKANLPTIPDITVADSGTGYVSAIAVDTTDTHKLNVTKTAIPSVGVTGGATESGKYISAIATNGHGISVTKTALPSLSKGTTTGSGNVVSDISVSGHTITLTKGITAITDVSGKANTNLNNISGLDTDNAGKAILVSSTGGIEFGEAGKVDDVQLNGTSVVSNKIANLPAYPTVNNGTFNIQGSGTTASSFGANQSGTTTLNIKGSGGTTVTKSANNEITISTGTIPTVNNGTLNLKGAGTTVTSFTANQSATSNLDIVGDGSTTVTPDAMNKKITISTPVLSTVATSGSYNDLSNKPTIPTVYNKTLKINGESTTVASFTSNSNTDVTVSIVGSGSTTVTPDATNKKITISTPVLSTVATSGSYNDLSNKPTIPTVNNGTLNIQGNGTTAGSFTANATGTTNINLVGGGGTTVTADATNKKITISTTLPTVNNGTLTITQNGTSKGTFSANSSASPTIALTDTWTPMTGATSSADGTVGYVNAIPPKDGYNTKYLRADGTWTVPPDHTYTVNNGTLTIKGENTTATTFTANSSTSPTLAIKGSGATTVTGASGTITVSSTDQSVTAVGNHYVPSGGTTTSASGGADTNITNLASGSGVNVVTGVTLDDAGHVTGITSKALRSVNNTYTVNNGKLSLQGNGTEVASFTANQSSGSTFNLANGTGISLTNDTTNKKITVNGVAVSKTSAGLCPALPDETTTTKFLRQDGSWQVPAYPTVNNGTLSIQGNGTTASTFTANQSGNTTLNIKGSGGTSVTKSANNEITVSSTAVGNGTLTIKQNSTSKGTFTANATSNTTVELTDTTYSAGDGLTLSGTEISETYPIYYARPNETTSTATLTATISNFPSAYKDGIMIALRMPFNNVASSTLNVNGLGAKNVYYGNNTTTATRWGPAGCISLLVYETTTTTNGCWKAVYSWESGNSGTWDTNTNDRFKYGEAVVAGSLVAVGTDGLTWKIRSGKELRMPLVGGRSTATYAVNGNYGALNWSIRGIALTELTNTTMQGTAFTVPTWAIGNTIYLRGTIGSGGGFVADGTITNAITNPSSGTLAYVPIGFVEKTNNNNATYMSLFMRDLDVFVIDTNGRVVSVNGKGIHASVSDSASSVAWGNVSSRPTKLSQFTNDVVNNATLTIQKNGTNVQTFTANQSTNATANITVPTKTSDLTNDSGFVTSSGVTSVATGVGLTGGTITGTGTIKAKLKSETASTLDSATITSTASRQYAVQVDKSGYLSVNVPWTDHTYTVNNGTFNIQGDGNTVQSFTANATGTTNMNFVSGTGISLTNDTTNKKITVNHSNSVTAQTSGVGSANAVPIIKYDAQGHITSVSTASIYPPTSLGMTGQLWKSNGNNPGGWIDQSSITSGACSGNSATATMMQYRATIGNRTFSRVSTSSSLSTDVSGYPWEYRISLTGATTNHVPVVTFGIPDLNKGVWSPICNVKTNGYLTIYSKSDLGTSVTVSCGYVLN